MNTKEDDNSKAPDEKGDDLPFTEEQRLRMLDLMEKLLEESQE
ncbi:hypothetical protein [Vallitalea okinawensis]|nr:hypothetical protein [Vallitalea okinawensis]